MKTDRTIEFLTVEVEDADEIAKAVSIIFSSLDYIREEAKTNAEPSKHTA